MIKPLFCIKEGLKYVQIEPKISNGDKKYRPEDFIFAVAKKYKNEPENLQKKENLGFLTIASYIMLEILHKVNPGICLDSMTTLEGEDKNISLQQAMVLFTIGVKIGQHLSKDIKIETKPSYPNLREDR